MRILIADDNQWVRRGIIGLLTQETGIEICGEASDSADVIQKAIESRPDVVLLDVSMPGISGLEATRLLRSKLPNIKILIVSQHDPKQMLARSLEMGAVGCIDKSRLPSDLLPAVRNLRDMNVSSIDRNAQEPEI